MLLLLAILLKTRSSARAYRKSIRIICVRMQNNLGPSNFSLPTSLLLPLLAYIPSPKSMILSKPRTTGL
jgi:hypothetical protein